MLTPLPQRSPLERLRAAGEVDSATRALDDLPEPLRLPTGGQSPSATLTGLRHDER